MASGAYDHSALHTAPQWLAARPYAANTEGDGAGAEDSQASDTSAWPGGIAAWDECATAGSRMRRADHMVGAPLLSRDQRSQSSSTEGMTAEALAVACKRPDLHFALVAARKVKELGSDGAPLPPGLVVLCVEALEVSSAILSPLSLTHTCGLVCHHRLVACPSNAAWTESLDQPVAHFVDGPFADGASSNLARPRRAPLHVSKTDIYS